MVTAGVVNDFSRLSVTLYLQIFFSDIICVVSNKMSKKVRLENVLNAASRHLGKRNCTVNTRIGRFTDGTYLLQIKVSNI